jgi:hypothetical protein
MHEYIHTHKCMSYLDSSSPEHVVLVVGKGLGRSNNDTLSSMNTHGIEVLHVANSDTVVEAITHNLVLSLLPALDTLLDKHLQKSTRAINHMTKNPLHDLDKDYMDYCQVGT